MSLSFKNSIMLIVFINQYRFTIFNIYYSVRDTKLANNIIF